MAKITFRLEKIKELMQGKGFTHFYIPDQFNYDASVDDDFEYEIRYEGKNLFAGYRDDYKNLRYTIMVSILRTASSVSMWNLMLIYGWRKIECPMSLSSA